MERMWQIQAGYPSRCLKVGVFVTQNPQGPRQIHSNEVRLGLVEFIWRVGCVKSSGGQRNQTIKPISCLYTFILFYIHPLSYFFLFPLQCLIIIYRISRISAPHFLGILCLLFLILLCLAVLWFTGSQHPSYIELPSTQHRYAVPSPGTSISRNTALVFFGACSATASVASAMAWTVYILCISIDETPLVLHNGVSFHYYPAEVHTHTQISEHHCWQANLLPRSASATKSNMQFSWYIRSISPSRNGHSLNMFLGPLLFKFHTHTQAETSKGDTVGNFVTIGLLLHLSQPLIVYSILSTLASGHGFSVGIWQIWWDS